VFLDERDQVADDVLLVGVEPLVARRRKVIRPSASTSGERTVAA
jgi:hypothetical protein